MSEQKTLLDEFAMAALPLVYNSVEIGTTYVEVAKISYCIAAAMMQEREAGALSGDDKNLPVESIYGGYDGYD